MNWIQRFLAAITTHKADASAHHAKTAEFFNPIFFGTDIATYRGAVVNGAGDIAVMMLIVPQDFNALTSIEVIFSPIQTAASMHFNISTAYGAYNGGEDWDEHVESVIGRDIGAVVDGINLAHDISDLVDIAALAAGDIIHIQVSYNATAIDSNAYVAGVRFKYS